jgi:endonuclease/exonuclease/phosphatase family metal-dependent hydrolase
VLHGAGPLRRVASLAIWLAVGVLVAWAVIRAFGLESGFPLAPLIAYTPEAGLAAVLVALIATVLRLWVAAAVAGAVAMLIAVLVLPRAFPAAQSGLPSSGPELRVMTVNLYLGEAEAEAVVQLVRDERVNLLSLQELTPREVRALRRAGLERLLPERAVVAAPGSSGAGLFSRWPLERLGLVPGSARLLPMPRARLRVPGAGSVEVVDVHPPSPVGSKEVSDWSRALGSLPPADPDGAVRILLGDFNATLDHQVLRDVLDEGYVDAADTVGKALTPTWRRGGLLPPTVTIDHVLVDRRVRVRDVGIHEMPGSDHRAVTADLVLPMRGRSRAGG